MLLRTYVELNLDSPWLYCSIESFLQTHTYARTHRLAHSYVTHTYIHTFIPTFTHTHTHTPTVGHYTIQVKAQVFTYGLKIIRHNFYILFHCIFSIM